MKKSEPLCIAGRNAKNGAATLENHSAIPQKLNTDYCESVLVALNHVQLCDPVDCSQPPLSMEFSMQEYWSG